MIPTVVFNQYVISSWRLCKNKKIKIQEVVILLVVLCGCETVILSTEHKGGGGGEIWGFHGCDDGLDCGLLGCKKCIIMDGYRCFGGSRCLQVQDIIYSDDAGSMFWNAGNHPQGSMDNIYIDLKETGCEMARNAFILLKRV
jgi:hypothetical protein